MNKKFMKWCFCFALLAFFMPLSVCAMERTATNQEQFFEALEDYTVDSIVLDGEITISRSADGKDNALVIPRTVKISGGSLYLERAGIILGGAVSFQDTSIYFANPVRNAIIANGHSLTLDSVSDGGSSYLIHLFCGGITDYTGGNRTEIPECGEQGQIIIRGDNQLGNIYGGSLSDVGSTSADQPNDFAGEAVISLENGADGFGEIYAHGAREDRTGENYNGMISDAELYKASGGVSIQLKGTHTITVHGKTGGSKDASFIYTDGGKGYACMPLLDCIGNITLCTGDDGNKANLVPAQGSSFSSLSASVVLPEETILDLTNMGQVLNDGAVDSFSGGGILILNKSQTFTITGEVDGTTKLAIGGLNVYEDGSTGIPEENHTYIMASQSAEDSFELLSPDSGVLVALQKDLSGNWTAVFEEYVTIISSISMPETVTAEADNSGIHIPVDVTYCSEGFDYLTYVPIKVFVNDREAALTGEIDYGYTYISGTTDKDIEFYFNVDATGESEVLCIYDYGVNTGKVPEGIYELVFMVPAENTADGKEYTFSVKLQVGNAECGTTSTVTEIFPDVVEGQWYVDCIQYVYDKGVMTGSGGLFNPVKKITRAQVVSILYRAEGSPAITGGNASEIFSDIKNGEWYNDAVYWAYHAGIAAGNSNTKMFNANKIVTREQLAVFFYKYADFKGMDITSRGDLSSMVNADAVQSYAEEAIGWAVGTEIISGSKVTNEDGTFFYDLKPQDGASRAQMASMMMRLYNYMESNINL